MHKAIWNGTLVAVKILKISSAIALADFRSELEVRMTTSAVEFLQCDTKNGVSGWQSAAQLFQAVWQLTLFQLFPDVVFVPACKSLLQAHAAAFQAAS